MTSCVPFIGCDRRTPFVIPEARRPAHDTELGDSGADYAGVRPYGRCCGVGQLSLREALASSCFQRLAAKARQIVSREKAHWAPLEQWTSLPAPRGARPICRRNCQEATLLCTLTTTMRGRRRLHLCCCCSAHSCDQGFEYLQAPLQTDPHHGEVLGGDDAGATLRGRESLLEPAMGSKHLWSSHFEHVCRWTRFVSRGCCRGGQMTRGLPNLN